MADVKSFITLSPDQQKDCISFDLLASWFPQFFPTFSDEMVLDFQSQRHHQKQRYISDQNLLQTYYDCQLTIIISDTCNINIINDAFRIITDDSRVMLQIVAALIDRSRGVINNCNLFIVQAKESVIVYHAPNLWTNPIPRVIKQENYN